MPFEQFDNSAKQEQVDPTQENITFEQFNQLTTPAIEWIEKKQEARIAQLNKEVSGLANNPEQIATKGKIELLMKKGIQEIEDCTILGAQLGLLGDLINKTPALLDNQEVQERWGVLIGPYLAEVEKEMEHEEK